MKNLTIMQKRVVSAMMLFNGFIKLNGLPTKPNLKEQQDEFLDFMVSLILMFDAAGGFPDKTEKSIFPKIDEKMNQFRFLMESEKMANAGGN